MEFVGILLNKDDVHPRIVPCQSHVAIFDKFGFFALPTLRSLPMITMIVSNLNFILQPEELM